MKSTMLSLGFPCGSAGKRIHLQCRRPGFNPRVGKIPWRREMLPISVFWPGGFHGLYSPWGCKDLDMTELLSCSVYNSVLRLLKMTPLRTNAGLEEAQAGIKIAGRNINNLRYADDITLMAESEEELKSLLMKVKVESEKVGLKLFRKLRSWHPVPSLHGK